jgi:hypothetical protein
MSDPDPRREMNLNDVFCAQAASEKREAMEAKLRAKLEEEVRDLREEGGGGPGHAHHHHQQDTEGLLRKLSQAEEKVSRPREILCVRHSVADPDLGSGIRCLLAPGSGIRDG